jgi:alpha-maltose-1-phosphate synthase
VAGPSEPNAAFYFNPENYQTSGDGVVGRQSATGGFLRGFIQHGGTDRFFIYADTANVFEEFQRFAVDAGARADQAAAFLPVTTAHLKQLGTVFRPGPDLGDLAWRRRHFDQRDFSICGITHTVSETIAMQVIGNLMIAPVQPWDALVCTTECVKGVIERLLADWADYLGARFEHDVQLPCRLPVIPLGVDSAAMAAKADDSFARATLRETLGIKDGDIALLYAGRLNHVEKANPIPMYLAAEAAAANTGVRLHLIQAGQATNAEVENAFKQAAAAFAPKVNHHFIDGRRDDLYDKAWAAADIFISLSDNIQESFGLTPIEAMAAGLPVVISNYNGYRESVRDGVEGLTVPSAQPAPGVGAEMAFLYDSGFVPYPVFTAAISQSTAVDVPAAAEALSRLIENGDLRARLGAAGQQRAGSVYDWRHVVRAHQELWTELTDVRTHGKESVPPFPDKAPFPLAPDPFGPFLAHATGLLDANTTLLADGPFDEEAFQALYRSDIATPLSAVLLDEADTTNLLKRIINAGVISASDATKYMAQEKITPLYLTLGWLAKVGLIAVTATPIDAASRIDSPFGRSETWRKLGSG